MDLGAYDTLELEVSQGWLTVWFNDPERRNPLTAERGAELIALSQTLADTRNIRGVIFRGRGGIFCAGGDLKAFQAAFSGGDVRETVLEISRGGAQVFDAINRLPQFTIMVIEGAAMAGGVGLACCGDAVIAQRDAKFALTETKLGIVAAQIAPFVQRRIGRQNTRQAMLRAATLVGEEALRIGLADALFSDADDLDRHLSVLRADIQAVSPNALAATKALLADMDALPRADQIARAANDFADCLLSDDGKEGVASFLQKRKPKWAEDRDV